MNPEQKTFTIEFGALASHIEQQLKEQGIIIPIAEACRFENIAFSITMLHLQDIIPDSVRNNARKKLMKKISASVHKVRE